MRGISWLAANQLASQEGLCTVEWESIRNILAVTNECKPAIVSCNTESPSTVQIFCPATRTSLRIRAKTWLRWQLAQSDFVSVCRCSNLTRDHYRVPVQISVASFKFVFRLASLYRRVCFGSFEISLQLLKLQIFKQLFFVFKIRKLTNKTFLSTCLAFHVAWQCWNK